mmetsp:Transcript_19873/g.28989  ORF Transcript_19873/g.28989 Transcript_19873/m.28989 type:complete len:121 (+) Transcript_19873:198-560(+)
MVTKCVKATKEALVDGKSATFDNTKCDERTHKMYIVTAKSLKLPFRCVFVDAAKEESFHMNAWKGANGNPCRGNWTVPDMVINSFYKNLFDPNKNEGFAKVMKLKIVPGPFDRKSKIQAY